MTDMSSYAEALREVLIKENLIYERYQQQEKKYQVEEDFQVICILIWQQFMK